MRCVWMTTIIRHMINAIVIVIIICYHIESGCGSMWQLVFEVMMGLIIDKLNSV
ncbi:MAG: hypothetical protein ACKPKO_12890 [Candidatus Fonsibacter sp.]